MANTPRMAPSRAYQSGYWQVRPLTVQLDGRLTPRDPLAIYPNCALCPAASAAEGFARKRYTLPDRETVAFQTFWPLTTTLPGYVTSTTQVAGCEPVLVTSNAVTKPLLFRSVVTKYRAVNVDGPDVLRAGAGAAERESRGVGDGDGTAGEATGTDTGEADTGGALDAGTPKETDAWACGTGRFGPGPSA